jgi:uncharacterized protein (TIGR03437 family)
LSRIRFTNPTPPAPAIITEENTDSAVALDSVTMVRDPFPLTNPFNFSTDGRTHLMFFVTNFELLPGETTSAVNVQAQDAAGNTYPLTVEFVRKVPGFDWLVQIVVRLPSNLPAGQSVFISVTLHGQTSNKARVRMK